MNLAHDVPCSAFTPGTGTHVDGSVANAFRTSDWETPNRLAIRDGVIPALYEARIALI